MVDTVQVTPEETGPNLEEEAKQQEEAQKQGEDPKLAGEENTEERPEWLPEKFKTPEDMAKAYAELEKKQGGEETPTTEEVEEAAEKAVEASGLNMDELSAEFAEKGELSAESLEKLEKAGITKEMVDTYISGQQAKADAVAAELLSPVGGQEAYDEIISWAADNLEDADIDAFNKVLEGGDMAATKMAVENLHAKYIEANGEEPGRQLSGKPSGALAVYESTADLMKDMNNPEYKTNPAFRKKVEDKLARSNIM